MGLPLCRASRISCLFSSGSLEALGHMPMQGQNLKDWLNLIFLPGIGCTLINRLLVEFADPASVLHAAPSQLERVAGVGKKLALRLTRHDVREQAREAADRQLQKLSCSNVSVIPLNDPCYPEMLRNIQDPPILLFCKGNTQYLNHPGIALVGSRSATVYGKRVSSTLGRDLAGHNIPVISGMALGIDGEAHAGALKGNGPTVGVLGCGVDVVYPVQNKELFKAVEENGLLVSEYPLGTQPDAYRFPERNRIISGLSLGVVVVEATKKSGSLITARLALDQNREVFAVPGRIDSAKSQGTHRLLQQGAKLVHSVEDILEEFHFSSVAGKVSPEADRSESFGNMDKEEQHLLSCLDTYPVNIDELVRLSGYDAPVLADLLVRLELKGAVRQLPGQQYELCR